MWPWATVASSRYWSRVFIFWVPGDYRTDLRAGEGSVDLGSCLGGYVEILQGGVPGWMPSGCQANEIQEQNAKSKEPAGRRRYGMAAELLASAGSGALLRRLIRNAPTVTAIASASSEPSRKRVIGPRRSPGPKQPQFISRPRK